MNPDILLAEVEAALAAFHRDATSGPISLDCNCEPWLRDLVARCKTAEAECDRLAKTVKWLRGIVTSTGKAEAVLELDELYEHLPDGSIEYGAVESVRRLRERIRIQDIELSKLRAILELQNHELAALREPPTETRTTT